MAKEAIPAIDRARAAWGADLPDWIEALAMACDATKQVDVARRLGRSAATVSNVINNKYKAGLNAVEQKVRIRVMANTVLCPHAGAEISIDDCITHAIAPMPMSNAADLRAWMACRDCLNNTSKRSASC